MANVTIPLEMHAKQAIAFETQATEVLYGGAAGGGKSWLMRAAAIVWCAAIPGLQVYIFRRISDDLIRNHVEGPKGFRALLAPWARAGFCNIVEDEIRFWNGSKIYLCHCKDEKDRFKYQGAEIHVLLIDELTTFTDVIYRFLRSRVRMVGINLPPEYEGRFPRILCGSNPGNIGHHFVKATFIDGAVPLEVKRAPLTEGGMMRQYIPARLADNPSMATDDPGYGDRLDGLGNVALVKAMKDGDWNVIAGAFFDCWSTERHVVRPFAIPPHWTRFMSFDWGSAKPFSVGWWAVSDGSAWRESGGQWVMADEPLYPTGALIRYREWYGARGVNEGLGLSTDEVALGIVAREKGDHMDYRIADPACWKADGGPSHAETMMRHGVTLRRGDNSRIPGWTQVRDRLLGQDGAPMLYVFDTCTALIRTLPALQHDEHKPEDVDSDGEDHAPDEARYACMSRPWTRVPEVRLPIRGALDMTMTEAWKHADPRSREGRGGRI